MLDSFLAAFEAIVFANLQILEQDLRNPSGKTCDNLQLCFWVRNNCMSKLIFLTISFIQLARPMLGACIPSLLRRWSGICDRTRSTWRQWFRVVWEKCGSFLCHFLIEKMRSNPQSCSCSHLGCANPAAKIDVHADKVIISSFATGIITGQHNRRPYICHLT